MSTSHSEIIQILEATVGQEWVKTNPDDLDTYGRDWTKFFPPDPLAAVLPKNIDEVAAIVKNANSHGFALVPSGGRTGLSGGAVATKGEVVIAFDRMNKILDYSGTWYDKILTNSLAMYKKFLNKGIEAIVLFLDLNNKRSV